jgi:hypothetical protein
MAYLKEQCICIKICFILGKCASGTHEMSKTAFSDILLQRTWTFEWFFLVQMCGNFPWRMWAWGHPSPSHTDENVEKVCKTMYDDQCHAILQCLRGQVYQKCLEWWWNQDCWVSAAISGSWQNGCCPPPTWFGPLWFLLVSKNKIASLRASLLECPQNSRTVAICLVYNSQSLFQLLLKPWRRLLRREQQW